MSGRAENIFKALADNQRRRILTMLRAGDLAAGEIAAHLNLTPATISHHLDKLKKADLVRSRREGQQRIYTLNASVMEEALILLARILQPEKESGV